MPEQEKIPVTILTGFLGSGKTTLLNNLLNHLSDKNVAVIINEFGDTAIDSHLVVSTKEEIIEINSGCICCNVRGDLIRILQNIRQQDKTIDHIIIETTGMANPAPVIQTFLMDEQMFQSFEIDSVITMIDTKHALQHLAEEELQEQIAFADVLVMNKMDLITIADQQKLEKRMNTMNPTAKRFYTSYSKVDMNNLIGIKSFDLEAKLKIDKDLITKQHHHNHNNGITSIVFRENRPLDLNKVNKWFAYLVRIKGENLYRYKGVLHIKQLDRKVVFQGVHMLFSGTEGNVWSIEEERLSEMVIIGKHLNYQELEKGFQYCLA